jgi:hypothetical protein
MFITFFSPAPQMAHLLICVDPPIPIFPIHLRWFHIITVPTNTLQNVLPLHGARLRYIDCPLMLYPNMLAMVEFSSKIHLWYFRKCSHHFHQSNVGVDSSSQQKPFRSFRLRDLSKFHPLLHIIHLPHYILSVQSWFSAKRKEKVGQCNIRTVWWLRCAFEWGNA